MLAINGHRAHTTWFSFIFWNNFFFFQFLIGAAAKSTSHSFRPLYGHVVLRLLTHLLSRARVVIPLCLSFSRSVFRLFAHLSLCVTSHRFSCCLLVSVVSEIPFFCSISSIATHLFWCDTQIHTQCSILNAPYTVYTWQCGGGGGGNIHCILQVAMDHFMDVCC